MQTIEVKKGSFGCTVTTNQFLAVLYRNALLPNKPENYTLANPRVEFHPDSR